METSSPEWNDGENPFEGLRPLATKLNRDRMLFEAGRASKPASRGRLLWPILTMALALGLIERESRVVEGQDHRQRLEARIAALENQAATIAVASYTLPPNSYGELSRRIRSGNGDDGLFDNDPTIHSTSEASKDEPNTPILRVMDSRSTLSF